MNVRTSLGTLVLGMLCCMQSPSATAQSIINTTGNTVVGNGFILEYSIGEIAIITINSPANLVTQGLLQPMTKIVIADCSFIDADFQTFPNPVQNTLSLSGVYNWIDSYVMYASDGRLIAHSPFYNNTIDMTRFAAGVYFIKLLPGCNGKFKTLKIVKQ